MQHLTGADVAELECLFVDAIQAGYIRLKKDRPPNYPEIMRTTLQVYLFGVWVNLIWAEENTSKTSVPPKNAS